MSIVFFEGFNCNDGDDVKPTFEFVTPNDLSKVTFAGYANTNEALSITSRPAASGISLNNYFSITNFTDPLSIASGFGIGFWLSDGAIRYSSTDYSSSPHRENLISFYSDSGCNNEKLRLDVIRTTYSGNTSIGLGVYQNNSLVTTYDFSSPIGYSWSFGSTSYSSLYSENDIGITNNGSVHYLEIYINSKNTNQIAIKYSSNSSENIYLYNSSNNIYTSISGFNGLSGIRLYGASDNHVYPRAYDDLYISASNSISGALLGCKTKIYKLLPLTNSDTSVNEWINNDDTTYFYGSKVSSNDGDGSYIKSSTSGNIALFNIDNFSSTPSGVNGIKISNIIRKNELDYDMKVINVITSGDGGTINNIGPEKIINSLSYTSKSSFIFTNPITSSGWTVNNINDMQIGIKNLGKVI